MKTRPKSSLGKWPLAASSADAPVEGGVTRRDVLALLAALGVPASAVAQDPVKLAPKSYRVALENERTRVLEYFNRPGLGPCGRGLHYHPAHVDVILTDMRVKVVEDGKTTLGKVKAGDVLWFDAEWHEVENVDKTASRVYMIEFKDAKWKPSTG
ncbi:MAG TPA: hypothetical protein VGR65_02285 [Casimicrobiaceae bacterium]|nr:hypothetical protein [Casimicrobiaceae bacterium]